MVLFLDTFAEARRGDSARSTSTVRAAAALAARYLGARDRVGAGRLRRRRCSWLLPATGARQLYRIVDALLDTEVVLSYAWKDVDVHAAAARCRRRRSCSALTPLLDDARRARAARPARARLRRGRRRGLADAVRRRRPARRRDELALAALAAAARRAALPLRARRRPGRRVARGRAAGGGDRGGGGIQAARPSGARVARPSRPCSRRRGSAWRRSRPPTACHELPASDRRLRRASCCSRPLVGAAGRRCSRGRSCCSARRT